MRLFGESLGQGFFAVGRLADFVVLALEKLAQAGAYILLVVYHQYLEGAVGIGRCSGCSGDRGYGRQIFGPDYVELIGDLRQGKAPQAKFAQPIPYLQDLFPVEQILVAAFVRNPDDPEVLVLADRFDRFAKGIGNFLYINKLFAFKHADLLVQSWGL